MEILLTIIILLVAFKKPLTESLSESRNSRSSGSSQRSSQRKGSKIVSPPLGRNTKGYFDRKAFTSTYDKLRGK